MSSLLKCACLFLLVITLSAPAADPPSEATNRDPLPAPRPDYTAFPDLKPTEFDASGRMKNWWTAADHGITGRRYGCGIELRVQVRFDGR